MTESDPTPFRSSRRSKLRSGPRLSTDARQIGCMMLAVLGLLVPTRAEGQQATCRWEEPSQNATRTLEMGGWVLRMTTPNIVCSDGRRIQADQLVSYEDRGLSEFTGNVYFEDKDQTLRSQWAQYQEQVGRLEAQGAVELVDRANGTQVTGQNLRYLREGFGRSQSEIVVTGGRPRALMVPNQAVRPPPNPDPEAQADTSGVSAGASAAGDSATTRDSTAVATSESGEAASAVAAEGEAATEPTPYDVTADRIEIVGNTYFRASGRVEVLRDSMDARSDSLEYDQEAGVLFLDGSASLQQGQLDTRGREIMIRMPGDVIRDLVVRGNGVLTSDQVDLNAPFIRLELDQGELQGLWAAPLYSTGTESLERPMRTAVSGMPLDSADFIRPVVRSEDIEMVGDSLDIRAPGQQLERVTSIGRARAESSAGDSLNVERLPDFALKDWIQGDTVVAVFVQGPEPDTNGDRQMVLERLEARGSASSLYRMAPDSTSQPGQQMAPAPADSTVVIQAGDPSVGPTQAQPAIHYVRGAEIVIFMIDGAVDRMEVTGLEQGIHLEPQGSSRSGSGGSS